MNNVSAGDNFLTENEKKEIRAFFNHYLFTSFATQYKKNTKRPFVGTVHLLSVAPEHRRCKPAASGETGAYWVSEAAYNEALKGTECDIQIMMQRRPGLTSGGISPTKSMGALLFRLARGPIVHFHPEIVDLPRILEVQTSAALLTVCKYLGVLGYLTSSWMTEKVKQKKEGHTFYHVPFKEMQYQLQHRHINQEAIVAWLDAVVLASAAHAELLQAQDENAKLRDQIALLKNPPSLLPAE